GYGYGYGSGRHGGGITFVLKNKSSKEEAGGRPAGGGEKTAAGPKDPPLPTIKTIDLITHVSPKSNISESYRSIRTAILLSTANPGHKIFSISSSLPSEGKSATAANLAVTLAQTGKRVLLLDADLRKPRIHRIFKLKNQNGLTNFLTGTGDVKELVKVTVVPDLYIINSGPLPPNPAELLGSDKMAGFVGELKAAFDYILVDTPPVLAVIASAPRN
ncbi:MAG TPA: CpsD/CapB family tyrosine-protein kinase, partial [Candidatus Aminicenantes bacterium]|nr:CpsD/CapB family tyrosine-protein kinase [Candidatus Aminicenantes bacterium]